MLIIGCTTPAATPVLLTATPTLPPMPTPTSNKFAHLSGLVFLANYDKGNTLLVVAADHSSEERFEISSDGDYAASPDSATILHSYKGKISKVNLSTGTESLINDMGDGHNINNLNFSPDGKRLAFTDYGVLYVMELADGQKHQVYSSSEGSYFGGLTAACEIQYLMWSDKSNLIFYVGHQLPDAISGDAKKRTVTCSDTVWYEVDSDTGNEQQLDHVSLFSEEFQRPLEESFFNPCLISPTGLRAACHDIDTVNIVEQDGKINKLNSDMGLLLWSYDGNYFMGVVHTSLLIVPADLSEPPILFHDCWCSPLLWLPPANPNK